jgi:DNA-binding response OmpR family regulator
MESKILIIEEKNKDLTDKIAAWLIEQGHKVEKAANIRDAYIKIDDFQPELIIRNCQRTGGLSRENNQICG